MNEFRAGARRALKEAAASVLERTGARGLLGEVQRYLAGGRRVSIFAWHRVVPDFERMRRRVIPGMLTSVETFDRQIAWIGRSWRIVPLAHALDVFAGRAKSDRDLAVITFDDGYADFLEHALPILEKHGAPATLYVSSGHVDTGEPFLHDRLYRSLRRFAWLELRPRGIGADADVAAALERIPRTDPCAAVESLIERHGRDDLARIADALERFLGDDPKTLVEDCRILGWDGLREAQARGVSIGAHTVDHRCLPNETLEEVERQLQVSRARIEEQLGAEVRDFAYPNGWYSPRTLRQVAGAGFRSAVTTEDRAIRQGHDPLALGRKCVWEFTSRGLFGWSDSVNSCNLDGTLGFLGLSRWVPGERDRAAAR
ncbi:MAG TPA: polysaccharide deacetylase family protein [Vulgatibacter sp.]|nr:polysaccharide deacetylase family protein [Vulgatibacter sp.]